MNDVKKLWEIQTLTEKLQEIEKQTKSIPEFRELKNLKEEIERSQSEVRKLNDEVINSKNTLQELEKSLAVLREKVNGANQELYNGSINNIKEIEAVQKSIDLTREKIDIGDEQAYKMMEVLEENEKQIRSLLKVLDAKKKEFRNLNQYYNEKKLELGKQLQQAASERDTLLKSVNPEMIKLYQSVCRKFSDQKGVAHLKNGVCSGCCMTVSFDLLKQARVKEAILYCDNCGRMLVVDHSKPEVELT